MIKPCKNPKTERKKLIKSSSILENKVQYDSYFDKTVKDYLKVELMFYVINVVTLGIAYPWALCMKYKAEYHHTVICGKRLKFIGQPRELIRHWLWWWALTVVTLGIYSIVVHNRMLQWKTANTVFEDAKAKYQSNGGQ